MRNSLEQQQNKLSISITGLNHLSPLNTLSRGYSISMLNVVA
jgi:exonuclease VII large subunit